MRLIDADALVERHCEDCTPSVTDECKHDPLCATLMWLADAPTIDPESLRPQSVWEWFEEWSPSTPEHPRECDDCGWRCGRCKAALEDVVGGYWDNFYEEPKLTYCPNCGARMGGGD